MTWISILTIIGCFVFNSFSLQDVPQDESKLPKDPPFLSTGEQWADSILNTMNLDEKIGQLFMVAAYSNLTQSHVEQVEALIKNHHIGGLIFMQGGPHRQAILLNKYQEISKVPLLIGMDAEWSLSMRLDSVVLYPRQMMIAAANNEELIYDMGKEFARQLKRVGVHVSFSPDVDVNNNPLNPVINTRSFGENPEKVAKLGWMYAKGLQENNVMAVAKHFPGHGDTNVDSHKALPIIKHSRQRLDSVEFYPFRYCIRKGVGGVMISHLYMPEIDSTPNLPTTLSKIVISDLLKGEMGFKGLVFTDAMNMQGVTKYFSPGDAEFRALLAGNDILVFAGNVPHAINLIKSAIEKGDISEQEINTKVRKILQAKYWAGLNNYQAIDRNNLTQDLNSPEAKLMQQKLIESSITLVRNSDDLIPLSTHDSIKIASLGIGVSHISDFQTRMSYYTNIKHFTYGRDFASQSKEAVLKTLSNYDVIIFGFHKVNAKPSENYGVSKTNLWLINELAKEKKVIVDIFGTPYALSAFENCDDIDAIIVSHNDWKLTRDFSAQLIFGGIGTDARLPVSAGKDFKEGMGVSTKANKLKYSSVPEEAGIDSKKIPEFDYLIKTGITNKAYPGCQVLAARNGVVFYNKSFGKHTYEGNIEVSDFDIYDLASVTKIMASTLSVMKLYEEKKIDLDDKFSKYLTDIKKTNKANISIRDAMLHQAGFTAWIPYYKSTISPDSIRIDYYSDSLCEDFSYQVADNLYLRTDYKDSIFAEIYDSDLGAKKRYRYSD
ncbi:MAG: serine hydrolase, partial [Bacteroidales bacterium]|nr:serine hydrolase [Bacteroidales bacterium]